MKYISLLQVYGNVEQLFAVLQPELKHAVRERSSISIAKKKEYLEIKITAQDSVALRASQNNVTKLLTVYEKLGA